MGGEQLHGAERVVVAPATGRFVALPVDELDPARPGTMILAGSPFAAVVSSGRQEFITTPFTGVLAGLLAHDGERVREGQPVAWLRARS